MSNKISLTQLDASNINVKINNVLLDKFFSAEEKSRELSVHKNLKGLEKEMHPDDLETENVSVEEYLKRRVMISYKDIKDFFDHRVKLKNNIESDYYKKHPDVGNPSLNSRYSRAVSSAKRYIGEVMGAEEMSDKIENKIKAEVKNIVETEIDSAIDQAYSKKKGSRSHG